MRAVLCALCVLLAGTAHAADRLPKSMLGKWATELAACTEQSSEIAMTVEPRNLLFYEHGHSVSRIVRQKDGSLKIWGYSFDEEGRSRSSITIKQLDADRLRVAEETYLRCKNEPRKGK